jgi:hypothetical protein
MFKIEAQRLAKGRGRGREWDDTHLISLQELHEREVLLLKRPQIVITIKNAHFSVQEDILRTRGKRTGRTDRNEAGFDALMQHLLKRFEVALDGEEEDRSARVNEIQLRPGRRLQDL